MAFVRLKKVKGNYYASMVESYRNEQGKVRQRVLANYGRVKRSLFRRVFNRKPSRWSVSRTVESGTRRHMAEKAQNGGYNVR